jgi:acyl-CoA hydrolase
VAQLPTGAKVTLGRNDIDYVVTEYGVAHLKGRSVRDRVEAMINIAHPDYRSELRAEAERIQLW